MAFVRQESGDHAKFLIRLLILFCQRSATQGVSYEEIASLYCDEKNKRPSEKTIQRAIKFLNVIFDPNAADEDRYSRTPRSNLPFQMKTGQENGERVRRYYFTRHNMVCVEGAPNNKSDGLAFNLYAQKKQLSASDFESLLALMTEGLKQKNGSQLLGDIEKYVYVSGFSPAQSGQNLQKLLQALQAVQRRRPVRFQYTSASTGEVSKYREVNPYGLLFRHGVWYMVGQCREANERRIFRIDHMDRMSMQENTTYSIPADFSLENIYGKTWGIWTESKCPHNPEKIELEVASNIASHFGTICYHTSQRVEKNGDGSLRVRFEVSGAQEMIPWLLSWGSCVQVLEPAWLRQRVIQSAKDLLQQYEEKAN